MKPKVDSLKKTNKIGKLLTRLTRKKRENNEITKMRDECGE